jgi:cytoskeletal protein CcmA (bactofilin family)
MSLFAKRKEDDTEMPGRGDMPSHPASQTNQTPAATTSTGASRPMPAAPRGSSAIGRTVTIKGDLRSDEDLQIDGQMEGRLDLGQHRLTVTPNGKVQANITAREVDVHGVVNGNVEAAERIIIRKNSKLIGDLKMASVVIEDGAYFKGSIDITQPQVVAAPVRPINP